MKKLKNRNSVKVYHEIDDESNHYYWFLDGNEKVDLDWGETGHIPNSGDQFPHPKRDMDLHLDGILWSDDDP